MKELLYIEIGRLAYVNFGPDYKELFIIVDIIDQNQVLGDNPDFEIRRVFNIKRMSLTPFVLNIQKLPSKKDLKEALAMDDVIEKFNESEEGKALKEEYTYYDLNDFERWEYDKMKEEEEEKEVEVKKKSVKKKAKA